MLSGDRAAVHDQRNRLRPDGSRRKTKPRAVHRTGKRMRLTGASALPGGAGRQSLAHRQRVSVHAGAVRGRSDYSRNRPVNDFRPQRESRLPLYVDGHREVSCSRTMHAGFTHGSRKLLRNWRESAVFCGEKQRFQFACAELRSCHGA